jgi:hypothetical protein
MFTNLWKILDDYYVYNYQYRAVDYIKQSFEGLSESKSTFSVNKIGQLSFLSVYSSIILFYKEWVLNKNSKSSSFYVNWKIKISNILVRFNFLSFDNTLKSMFFFLMSSLIPSKFSRLFGIELSGKYNYDV